MFLKIDSNESYNIIEGKTKENLNMIRFDYKEEQSVTISQRYVGEDVNVEVLDEFGDFDYEFKIPEKDFIKMLEEYQKNNNII